MKCELKTIMPGVQVRSGARGKTVRFACMVNGKRFSKMAEMPVEMLIDPKTGRATKYLKSEYAAWVETCQVETGGVRPSQLRVPTIGELIEMYEDMAWRRNADPNHRKPSERSIHTALQNYARVVRVSGLAETRPYTELMHVDCIRRVFKDLCEGGVKGISAWSYIATLQTVTADWTIVEYQDRGFRVEQPIMPDAGNARDAPQYRRLSTEQRERIYAWYAQLATNADPQVYLAATIMINLAVRPIDVGALTIDNFPVGENGHRRLSYQPTKTKESSNRRVDVELPDALWEQIWTIAGARLEAGQTMIKGWRWVFVKLNSSMRVACGMRDSNKAAYELRKLCIDTVVRTQGVDQGVRISGDRRDTIERYYCDPYRSDVPAQLTVPLPEIGA